jgi:NAD(P)H-hydrate epimerase
MTIHVRPLSRQQVRQLDARAVTEFALPALVLMENAGRGAASWLAELAGALRPDAGGRWFSSSLSVERLARAPTLPRILVLCGAGNNGGDGGVLARHLDAWGFTVQVIWFARREQLEQNAAAQWVMLEKSGVEQSAWFDTNAVELGPDSAGLTALLTEAGWLVDGLLGTGLSRPVEGPLRNVIEAMNHSGKPIFALDLPSGLDADTGQPLGVAVRARATATFVSAKLGFTAPGASDYTGEVAIIDIGMPRCLLEPYLEVHVQ